MKNNTNSGKRHAIRVALIILVCIAVAKIYMYCAQVLYENTANKHWQGARYLARKSNPANISAADSCAGLLHTGDLVVRRGDDMTSFMLSQLNRRDKSYSHCGLVIVENGKPYVYHSIGGEDNPDALLRRDPAETWFSPANNLCIATYRYDMSDSIINRLVDMVYTYYREKRMFDMDFDIETDDRLYCSEMVYKAVSTATGDISYIPSGDAYGKHFTGVDDLYLNQHTRCICQVRYK
ncbi:MAG: hypothetical protein H6550_02930 [Chitinophagales bacterium]|nr:hypothetical protein [Chitinophagales bacterium]